MNTTSGSRRAQAGMASDPGATGLRDLIQQAITAYELAVTTQARVASDTARQHKQRLADLDAEEAVTSSQRAEDLRTKQAEAEAEAERVRALTALAAELTESANALLDRASLAHVRGFGPGSTDVGQHVATDEQAAAAFTAAQVASIKLRTTLLRLAQEYLDGGDWTRAREVAASLPSGSTGAVATEAAVIGRTACLGLVREALSRGNPQAARAQAEAWLQARPGDDEMSALLGRARADLAEQAERAAAADRAARSGGVREALSRGDLEVARAQAEAALQAHPLDHEISDLLLQAAVALAEQAVVAGDPMRAAEVITTAGQRHGADHSRLREITRRYPSVAWRAGSARLHYEFAGHSQPVRALAFTPDGHHLVSADDTEIKTWGLAETARGALDRTVRVEGTRGLTPDGMLALTKNGALCRTGDGHQVRDMGATAAHAFSRDGSLVVWAGRNKEWTIVNVPQSRGNLQEMMRRNAISLTQADEIWSQVLQYSGITGYEVPESAKVDGATQLTYASGYYSGKLLFVDSLAAAEVLSGRKVRSIALNPPQMFVDVAVSADIRKIGILSPRGELIVIDIDSGTKIHTFQMDSAASLLNSISFSSSGELVLATHVGRAKVGSAEAQDHTQMTIWDVATGRTYWSWNTKKRTGAVAFSPDGQLLATLAMNGTIGLFDVHAKRALPDVGKLSWSGPEQTFPCLAFSPDGSRLAASGYRDVKIWSL